MYAYERFNGVLKSFVINRAYPEGSMVQGYCTEEAVKWVLNYADPTNPIDVPKSRYEGRLTSKGNIGKKAITPYPDLFHHAHFHVLQQMSIVSEYLDEHKEMLLRDNTGRNELWLVNEHMRKFIGWLREWISGSDTPISKYLQKLAGGPIFTVVTYQGYNINGYTFYTERQDKKSTYQNSGVHVDAYDVMGEDKSMYYGQIQEIYELDFHGFQIPSFHCNWVDANMGVLKDKYGFITIDLNHQGYKSEPFVLANTSHKFSMFQTQQTKDLRWLYPKNDESLESRIPSSKDISYLRNDHHEKVKNFKKPRAQWKVAK
jgi:hypothetical protein